MSVDLSHVELPEGWEQAVVRARAVFSVGAIVAEGSSSSRSSIRPRSSSSSSSSSKERVKGQINNPEFEKKIKREATGRFGEKPRANIKLAKEETVEDFAPPADSYDEEQLNKRRGEAFERFSEDNKLDDKEKAVIEQWNRKMEQVQKVSPPPGDKVEKGRLEELKKEAFQEFQKDKKLDKNELELVRKWDEKLKEAEKREGPEESKGPNLPNPFLLALAPAIGVAGVAGIQAGSELAKKAREALDGSEIGAELEGSVKAQFGDLSIEAKAGVAAGLKNPEERPGIIEGFINGFLDVEVSTGDDEKSDKPSKPIPLPRKPKPESEPESDKPSEPIPLPRKPKPEPESEPEPEPEPESESEQDSGKYTVQKGDNLWNIVKANLPEGASNAEILEKTKGLYESNKETVGDDWNLIHPGQELDLGSLKPQPEPETPDSGAQEELPGKGEGDKEKDEGEGEGEKDEGDEEKDEGEKEKDEGEKEKDGGINPFLALLSPALALGLYAADKVGDAFKDSSFEASVKGEAKTRFGEMSSESQASMAVRLGNPETRKEAIQEFGGQRTAELKASISAKIQAGLDPESPTIEKLLKELEKQKQ